MTNQPTKRFGAAAVEMIIFLPLLALLFALAVDYARVFAVAQTLENAAYSGALVASGTTWVPGYPTTAADQARVAACAEAPLLNPALQPADVNVNIASGTATVTVTYAFPMATSVLFPSMAVTLQRTAVVRVAPRPGD